MDRIDEILEEYERHIKRADEGKCEIVSESIDFKNSFQEKYHEVYRDMLRAVVDKLEGKGHSAKLEEFTMEDGYLGFKLIMVPRHLSRFPSDRYFPHPLGSSISFVANGHTMTVDIETIVRPNIDGGEKGSIDKIPKESFNEDLLMEKIIEFLQKVFDETILLDFSSEYHPSGGQ